MQMSTPPSAATKTLWLDPILEHLSYPFPTSNLAYFSTVSQLLKCKKKEQLNIDGFLIFVFSILSKIKTRILYEFFSARKLSYLFCLQSKT